MASDTRALKDGKVREKVVLKPGFHLSDWVRLCQVSSDMSGRNGGPLRKVTVSELAQHKSQFDCWTAYNGKVYNITNYLHYHPGGIPKLMAGAGKDCTKEFNKFHAWVNAESMLSKCLVGTLVPDETLVLEEGDENDNEDEVKESAKSDDVKDTEHSNSSQSADTELSELGVKFTDTVLFSKAISLLTTEDNETDKS